MRLVTGAINMKMTSKRAATTISRYFDLKCKAEEFMKERKGSHYYHDIRFDEVGNIEEWVNTACNCHPEYSWEHAAYANEFGEWLDKKAKE